MKIDMFIAICILLCIMFLVIGVKYFLKKAFLKDKKCESLKEQQLKCLCFDSSIETKIISEVYKSIEKYFKIKSCYLTPNDKMIQFHNLDSFSLHENYEDFIEEIEVQYGVNNLELNDRLIDIIIKIQKNMKDEI